MSQTTIVLTEFESDAVELALERNKQAQAIARETQKAAEEKIGRIVAAHGAPPIPRRSQVAYERKDGRMTLSWVAPSAPALEALEPVAAGVAEGNGGENRILPLRDPETKE